MSTSPTADELISQAIDVVALGYPFQGSAEDKAAWMAKLQAELERREAKVRAIIRSAANEPLK